MACSSLQSGAHQEELTHRRSRLKIRRGPYFPELASFSSSSHSSCRMKKSCTPASRTGQPLIFHTLDPEVIVTEPAEFMFLVQRLTGSPATRKLLLDTRKWRGQLDPLKEGHTVILAPPAAVISCSSVDADHASSNHSPAASPACSNHSELSRCSNHEPQLPSAINQGAHSLTAPSSHFTKQLNFDANHPKLASIFANSATNNEENYFKHTSPMTGSSPLSPNCSLTTSSEGSFSVEGGGASSIASRDLEPFCLEEGSTLSTEEEGDINFFVFSIDSYYGELDQFLSFSNAMDPLQKV